VIGLQGVNTLSVLPACSRRSYIRHCGHTGRRCLSLDRPLLRKPRIHSQADSIRTQDTYTSKWELAHVSCFRGPRPVRPNLPPAYIVGPVAKSPPAANTCCRLPNKLRKMARLLTKARVIEVIRAALVAPRLDRGGDVCKALGKVLTIGSGLWERELVL